MKRGNISKNLLGNNNESISQTGIIQALHLSSIPTHLVNVSKTLKDAMGFENPN